MIPATTSPTGFSGETIWPLGQLRLLVVIGDATYSTKAWMNFMVVKSLSPYNGIIGRPGLKAIQAVPSTVHGMLKFPVKGGIVTICSTILIPTECASVTTSSVITREERNRPANFTVALHLDFPDQEVQPSGMTGVPRSVAEHRLNIREGYSPVRQKKRGQAPERAMAIQAEVQKLVEAGIMREVYYHDWLSNPFMVKKHDGSWRMCVDFTHLNKACPQDCYHLPEIDWKVEPLCGYPFKCFLDAYKGYHQIQLTKADKEKTAFHTGQGYTAILRCLLASKMLAPHFLIEMPGDVSQVVPAAVTQEEPWTLFTNGSSCVDGSGAGLILTNPEGVEFTYALMFQFTASNNEAEYEALVVGLRIAAQMGVKNVQVNVDSILVANQVLGTYVAKENNVIKYLEIVKGLVSGFTTFSISQVPRSKNKKADAVSKIASTNFTHLSKQVLVEVLENKSIKEKEVAAVIEEDGPTWMTQLVDYLKEGILPEDEKEARKLRHKARQYELMKGVLYRRSFLTPWLRCVGPLQADYVMREIHEGSCSPFPEGPGNVKILIVAMDYFTKWIEAKAVTTLTDGQVKKFVWDNIVCRFGNKNWVEELPHVLWAHRTMIKSSHGDTPFSLTYGTEAVIPTEIGMPTYRTAAVDVVNNDEELRLNLDLLEERRECAAVCEAKAKSKMMKYYNARVRGVAFKPGDFVYRSNDASHVVAGGKLRPKWEGPYEVTEALGNGAYKLRSTDGTILPRTWNVANLKRCYL
nr:reverse transcriptase domain-containing protein [Tanacetum cinerariifolium]